MNTDITAIILTKNESVNIVRCIESLSGLAQRIVVVDSGSEDHTVELAAQLGGGNISPSLPALCRPVQLGAGSYGYSDYLGLPHRCG